jgi:dihydrolipoamide dehydrogenase
VAAIRAAQLGMKTAIIEREHLGGICLNWGCIPTKALLRSAEILELTQTAGDYGIEVGAPNPNVPAMVKRSRQVSAQLNRGIEHLLKKNKVDVIWGEAKLTAANKVSVSASTVAAVEPCHPKPRQTKDYGDYSAKHIIIATGARPRELPILKPDGSRIVTYYEAMKPETAPSSLLIVGSGAIGMEFASFYATLGTKITIIEQLPNILPQEDPEVAMFLHSAFEKRGVEILTHATIKNCECTNSVAEVTLIDGSGNENNRTFEKVLSAVGVVPNVEGLGLEALGIEVSTSGITINTAGATTCKGIYAIGDVAGPPMLAHKAEHEAIHCVEAIASGNSHELQKTTHSRLYLLPASGCKHWPIRGGRAEERI